MQEFWSAQSQKLGAPMLEFYQPELDKAGISSYNHREVIIECHIKTQKNDVKQHAKHGRKYIRQLYHSRYERMMTFFEDD